jgi:uncharacterized membrane protein
MYLIIKWVHILLAITALGANITYGIWLARAARSPEHLGFVLRGVKILDDRVANPAYGFLLITGVGMVHMGGWSFSTPWILSSLVIYVVIVLFAVLGYTPTLKRQIQLVEEGRVDSSEYAAAAARNRNLGIILAVLAFTMTFLMVVKPSLWA